MADRKEMGDAWVGHHVGDRLPVVLEDARLLLAAAAAATHVKPPDPAPSRIHGRAGMLEHENLVIKSEMTLLDSAATKSRSSAISRFILL